MTIISENSPIVIATRGSALALAQANAVFNRCRKSFPKLRFEIRIIKTTGDKLQTASLTHQNESLPKGLFTKELEVALLQHQADLAVHSLKDLPTDLPEGLKLGAVTERADPRDVLIYRDGQYLGAQSARAAIVEWSPGQAERRGFVPNLSIQQLPSNALVATSSNRRKAQLLGHRPDLKVIEIRGNVVTRLQKLAERAELDALILAAAGLERLNFRRMPNGKLQGDAVPEGLLVTILEPEVMLPCVGQGALGIEIRSDDERIEAVCSRLNHFNTQQCVTAERAFLRKTGGGCHSSVAAYAEILGHQMRMRAVSFREGHVRRGDARRVVQEAVQLGEQLAAELWQGESA